MSGWTETQKERRIDDMKYGNREFKLKKTGQTLLL